MDIEAAFDALTGGAGAIDGGVALARHMLAVDSRAHPLSAQSG